MGSKVFRSFCLAKVTQKVPEVFTQQTSGEVAAALGVPAPGAPGQSQLPVSNPSLLKYAEANIIAPEALQSFCKLPRNSPRFVCTLPL